MLLPNATMVKMLLCLILLVAFPSVSFAQACSCSSMSVETIYSAQGPLRLFGSVGNPRVAINSLTTIDSGAQLEVYGVDGGLSLVSTTSPGSRVSKNAIFGPNSLPGFWT